MDTLLDKISMLILAKLHDAVGHRQRSTKPIGFERRFRQTVIELLRTEARIGGVRNELHKLLDDIRVDTRRIYDLDQTIDESLLNGDEFRAAVGQRELNRLRQRLAQCQSRCRFLQAEEERLQTIRDRLEVKLELMGLERSTLDEYLRRFHEQHSQTNSGVRWRVVEPADL